jgi:hypothetical protein
VLLAVRAADVGDHRKGNYVNYLISRGPTKQLLPRYSLCPLLVLIRGRQRFLGVTRKQRQRITRNRRFSRHDNNTFNFLRLLSFGSLRGRRSSLSLLLKDDREIPIGSKLAAVGCRIQNIL